MISEKQFWYWAALGVTPLTVGKTLPKNRRKKQHRRNDIVLLNSDVANSIALTQRTATMNESMEVELEYQCHSHYPHLSYGVDADNRCDVESTSRTQPEFTFVFEDDEDDEIDKLTGFRLSLAGLSSRSRACSFSQSSKSSDDHRDELHSHLYSSVLETVRASLVECKPHITEEMISRAIIHAFADSNMERQHENSADESDEVPPHDKYQDEVNIFCKAYDLTQGRLNQFGKRKKIIDFLQTVLDETFSKIRREEITSSDEVLRTMLSVLSILQLKVDTAVILPIDTIVLRGLTNNTTRTQLKEGLARFGTIKSVAIASNKGSNGFGYCCFDNEDSVRRAIANQNEIVINGVTPSVLSLLHGGTNAQKDSNGLEIVEGFTISKKTGRLLWSI
jgi:hypothetical protein